MHTHSEKVQFYQLTHRDRHTHKSNTWNAYTQWESPVLPAHTQTCFTSDFSVQNTRTYACTCMHSFQKQLWQKLQASVSGKTAHCNMHTISHWWSVDHTCFCSPLKKALVKFWMLVVDPSTLADKSVMPITSQIVFSARWHVKPDPEVTKGRHLH